MYGWQNLLGSVGLAVLKCRLDEDGLSGRAVQSALERVNRGPDLDGLRTDVLRHLFQTDSAPVKALTISEQHIPGSISQRAAMLAM